MLAALATIALLQGQVPQQQLPVLRASPVARIGLTPAKLVLGASDSMHVTAIAYDAAGNAISDAHLRFQSAPANAGTIDTSGWVYARGTGKVTGAVVSLMPGYKPVVQRFEVRMIPDAAERIRVDGIPQRLVVGQHVREVFPRNHAIEPSESSVDSSEEVAVVCGYQALPPARDVANP